MTRTTVFYYGLANELRGAVEDLEEDGPTTIPLPRERVIFLLVSASEAIDQLRSRLDEREDDDAPEVQGRRKRAEEAEEPRRRTAAQRAKVWRFAAKCSAGRHKADERGVCGKCGARAIGAEAPTGAPVVHFLPAVAPVAACGVPRANLGSDRATGDEDAVTCLPCTAALRARKERR